MVRIEHRLQDRKILIVDDDEDILSSIDLAMRAEGARTMTVKDGNAAVSAVHHSRPEAVILDMMLPRASGFVVLEKIMQEDDPPLVVMVTANQGKRHREYAKSLGVSAYFYKPVALERLIDTMVALLNPDHAETAATADLDEVPGVSDSEEDA